MKNKKNESIICVINLTDKPRQSNLLRESQEEKRKERGSSYGEKEKHRYYGGTWNSIHIRNGNGIYGSYASNECSG